jgi:hypothetical protein
MAAEISNNDLDFLCTLDGENGLWTPDRLHDDGHGYGFCGHDDRWFPHIINDSRFFSDPYWQLQECYQRYIDGTPLYGKSKCPKTKEYFTCPS